MKAKFSYNNVQIISSRPTTEDNNEYTDDETVNNKHKETKTKTIISEKFKFGLTWL